MLRANFKMLRIFGNWLLKFVYIFQINNYYIIIYLKYKLLTKLSKFQNKIILKFPPSILFLTGSVKASSSAGTRTFADEKISKTVSAYF